MRIINFVVVTFFFSVAIFCEDKVNLEQAVKDLSAENYDTRLKAKKILENSGLRAIPLLRKAANKDELELKEIAEKITADCFKYTNEDFQLVSIMGNDSKWGSTQKYTVELFNYLKDFFLKSYEKNSSKDPQWDVKIKKFIPMALDFSKNLALEAEFDDKFNIGKSYRVNEMGLRRAINELVELNCKDPLFLYLKSELYSKWEDNRFSYDEMLKACDELIKAQYSNYFKFITSQKFYAIKKRSIGGHMSPEIKELFMKLFDNWVEIGNDEIFKSRIGQRLYFNLSESFWDELTFKDMESSIDKISVKIGNDSWADHTIKSYFFNKKGWEIRGKSSDDMLSDDRREIFYKCVDEAESHALAAYQICPEYPDPIVPMIKSASAKPTKYTPRVWFEMATRAEVNNKNAFMKYTSALFPYGNSSPDDLKILGNEYLSIDRPMVNTAKYYMKVFDLLKYDIPIKSQEDLAEYECAIEQQIKLKPVNYLLYYNDLALTAFSLNDYQLTFKAIQETKGLFSGGWSERPINGAFVDRFVTFVEKYKSKSTGIALCSLQKNIKEKSNENIKIILEKMNKEIEPIDQATLVYLLMNIKNINLIGCEETFMDLLYQFGYRESALLVYMNMPQNAINDKIKIKLKERYGARTAETIDLTLEYEAGKTGFSIELEEKIKGVFKKDVANEKNLSLNEEYNKAQIRGLFYLANKENRNIQYYKVFSPYDRIFTNLGDCADFFSAYINANKLTEINSCFALNFQRFFSIISQERFSVIEKEIERLASLENDQRLLEEVAKIRYSKGSPTMLFELAQLLKERKLFIEAESLRISAMFCLEAYDYGVSSGTLPAFTLGYSPINSKETYQMLIKYSFKDHSALTHYLLAYHTFKLGHYHMAYEYLCHAQTMRNYDKGAVVNKKYINIKDMAQFIANEMLESKDLPEYIQFNLKDQFGVKIKKLETK